MTDAANDTQAEREAQKAQADKNELAERIARVIREDGESEPLKGLHFHRSSLPMVMVHGLFDPALCVIAQGGKEVLLGADRYRYDSNHYLLATVEMPVVSWVLEASKQRPYLSLHLELEAALVSAAVVEAGPPPPPAPADEKALNTEQLDVGLRDAVLRLVRLLDSPAEARVLAPLVTREIIHRLLLGRQGARLRDMAGQGGHSHQIAQAVERLRKDLDQPLRVDIMARELGMSVSGFHSHFKAVIGLSPLQFQKRVRLQEARRLMLDEELDAASAGYRVGYDDASHFSREYRSLFGVPPLRDVGQLREAVRASASR